MRDKREPTQSNAEARPQEDLLAGRVPRVLAARLKAARVAASLSQGAVAEAMRNRGFSWRQTTVAKSEAADRPVLFAEVAALSQIFNRPIDYFLYSGTFLDGLIDDARAELERIQTHIASVERTLMMLKKDEEAQETRLGLASAITRYRTSGDGGVLLDDVRALLYRWGRDVMLLRDVFETVDLMIDDVARVDYEAVRELAEADWSAYRDLTEEQLREESGEMLLALSDFIEGKKVPSDFYATMGSGEGWVNVLAPKLTDLLISAIDLQRSSL